MTNFISYAGMNLNLGDFSALSLAVSCGSGKKQKQTIKHQSFLFRLIIFAFI